MTLALKFIETTQWAILEDYLKLMAAVADRDLDSKAAVLEAIEKQFGQPIGGTREARVRGNVAIVPIAGPLFRYASFFSEISGATSYERLARDIATVMDDPAVAHVIFDINSPGGSVDGMLETASLIASYRGLKPMTAFVSHLGASAAYGLASAADEIIVTETSMVGSIGAVIGVTDFSKRDEKYGIQRMEFVSSQSPDKRSDPFSADETESNRGKKILQALVDKMGSAFIAKVAEYRGVTTETIVKTRGGLFVGSDAVEAGLADGMGTLEGMIEALSRQDGEVRPFSTGLAASEPDIHGKDSDMSTKAENPVETPVIDRAYLDANHADLVTEIMAEGVVAERTRILGIHSLDAPGFEQIKTDCMADPDATAGTTAVKIMAAQGEREKRRKESLRDSLDADEGDVGPVAAISLPGDDAGEDSAVLAVLAAAK